MIMLFCRTVEIGFGLFLIVASTYFIIDTLTHPEALKYYGMLMLMTLLASLLGIGIGAMCVLHAAAWMLGV